MSNPWDALADGIVSKVKERAKKFVEDNADLDKFLKDRAQALAKATYKYQIAPDDQKDSAYRDMKVVRQTIENKLAAVALKGQREQQKIFREILFAVFGSLVDLAPLVRDLLKPKTS
jgi:hypothetical protein